MRKLTTRQQRFIEECCVSHNATQAAIEAGYSKKTDNAPPLPKGAGVAVTLMARKRYAIIQQVKSGMGASLSRFACLPFPIAPD
jgi:hypothetical protein